MVHNRCPYVQEWSAPQAPLRTPPGSVELQAAVQCSAVMHSQLSNDGMQVCWQHLPVARDQPSRTANHGAMGVWLDTQQLAQGGVSWALWCMQGLLADWAVRPGCDR